MIVHDFSNETSILNQFILEMRDVSIQKDSMRFRRNVERVGEILCYEMSKTLEYNSKVIKTPLGEKTVNAPTSEIVLCSILRAGIPLHHGILNYFDSVENAFISAYRYHPNGGDDFEVNVKYLAAPSIEGKTLILADPMLATGKTLENVLKALKTHGIPEQIHIISIIGAKPGIELAAKIFPKNTHLWIAAVDNALNERGYIVPGLGDAGDLCYGPRLD
ncbi:uracil phosphoribosyltransferase [Aequorivita sp. SDUM287046]|uniref:Uracil phosphoribosyltransferase n=1 Tax=Aequorivita aurantiaca TaxID=3053356 RepID=A0ABT8DHG2_9FLAO|nr:uracil phosphoribosyltransferase [Aequorivita aurantiaca]MDN3724209.1 uracil phosphoribosyltransferase [Aequorivita aurantiaca]